MRTQSSKCTANLGRHSDAAGACKPQVTSSEQLDWRWDETSLRRTLGLVGQLPAVRKGGRCSPAIGLRGPLTDRNQPIDQGRGICLAVSQLVDQLAQAQHLRHGQHSSWMPCVYLR